MAQVIKQPNGDYAVQFTATETDTISGLPTGQLDVYLTLWLEERQKHVFVERFAALPPADKADVLSKMKGK